MHAEFPEHADENRRIWDANARWWDDRMGDGNDFQTVLIEPATERLLDAVVGDTVLDIACGAGRVARRLAERGARVVAFDCSAEFIRTRSRTYGQRRGDRLPRRRRGGSRGPSRARSEPIRQGRLHDGAHGHGRHRSAVRDPAANAHAGRCLRVLGHASLRWRDIPDIPPILVVRMRLVDGSR